MNSYNQLSVGSQGIAGKFNSVSTPNISVPKTTISGVHTIKINATSVGSSNLR